MPKAQLTNEAAYSIAIKPTAEVREALRMAASASGRTLTKEIERRLAASVAGGDPADDLVMYGWVNPVRDKLLGQVIGILAGRIEEIGPLTRGPDQDRGAVIAMVKVAVSELLDALAPAPELLPQDKATAGAMARQIINEMRWASVAKFERDQIAPDKEIVARMAKAWGVEQEKGDPL